MLKANFFTISVCVLSLFFVFPSHSLFAQSVNKKRYIERKAIKINVNEIVLADIPVASKLGVSYEFLLDRNYGIQLGMGFLGYPINMWGTDSMSRAWRDNVQQVGYNFDIAFRHYFDDADETSMYISTFFSTSRLWIDVISYPRVISMTKSRVALVLGYQKRWRSLYFDLSAGLGAKFQNYRTHLQPVLLPQARLSQEYVGGFGWNFELNKDVVKIAVPIQFVVGYRF